MGDITIRFFNVISLKLIGEKNFDMYNPPVVAGLFNLFFLYLDLMNFIILFNYSPDLETFNSSPNFIAYTLEEEPFIFIYYFGICRISQPPIHPSHIIC